MPAITAKHQPTHVAFRKNVVVRGTGMTEPAFAPALRTRGVRPVMET